MSKIDITEAMAAAEAVPGPGRPTADQALAEPLARLAARTARLDVAARQERARLGAQCGDMGAATIHDTSLRLARMETVQEELGYALQRMREGSAPLEAWIKAVDSLTAAAEPLGGSSTEVQRARVAGLAEVVSILRDEVA
jgi:hypothetical protein